MQNKWIVIILTLVVGFTGGVLVSKQTSKANTHAADTHMEGSHEDDDGHDHTSTVEVPAGTPAPTVDVIVHEDSKGGYNVQARTTNFVFSPENASGENAMGEGHAHVYVDGVKINRMYGEWHHLADIGDVGAHEITVGLYANDHSAYVVGGEKVADTETVTVEPQAAFDAASAHEERVSITERVLSPNVVTVTEGESVRFVITTDEAGDFHVAGYELEQEMHVGEEETVIEFVADKPGRYNLEMHPTEGHEDIEVGALVVNPK